MKRQIISYFLLHIFILFLPKVSEAHPGIGIVKDSKGNIYYTDLRQVWKLTPDGNKTAVVKNVHTHELYIDQQDNLFGEHLWYNGERLDTWGHYVWCLKNTGELVKEIEPTEGFLSNYSFVRDRLGNMYWVERFTVTRFMKKDKDGNVSKLAEGKFGFIGWLYSTAGGTLYFTEKGNLHKLTPEGKFVLMADGLEGRSVGFTGMGRNYDSYGIWTDNADNIYIAMIASKKINRISSDGQVKTILYSSSLWTACSGLFDNDGNLWLLENGPANETRVRKINKEKLDSSEAPRKPIMRETHIIIALGTGAVIAVLSYIFNKVVSKRKAKLQKQTT